MTQYLKYTFTNDETFINTFDELPLWSASFGLLLFKHLELKPGITAVDIGSGAGFPLTELAGRLGPSATVYGVDLWTVATQRAKQKIRDYYLNNVTILECSAEKIQLNDDSVDLIVSNLGINNFDNPPIVFKECFRLLKSGGRLALTSNITGHWKEFYTVFYQTLEQLGKHKLIPILKKDEDHRGTAEGIKELFTASGMTITKTVSDSFEMKFVDGTAFLNHHFVKLGWLTSWMGMFPKEELKTIFAALEHNLNQHANAHGGLTLSVPMLYMEGSK